MPKFDKLVKKVIPELLSNSTFENENFKVEFSYSGYDESFNRVIEDTLCTVVGAQIDLTNKLLSTHISTKLDLLYVPVMTEVGFKVGKSYKQVLDLYDKAKGWYLAKGDSVRPDDIVETEEYVDDDIPVLNSVMKLIPLSGRHLVFSYNNNEIVVANKSSGNKVGIGSFLKAFTGKSYKELLDLLGNNMYIINSLKNEKSLLEATKATAPLFLYDTNLDPNTLAKKVKRSLFDNHYLKVNEASRIRFRSATSFTTRANGTTLAESIELNGREIQAGTKLHRELLQEIDSSKITNLKVDKHDRIYDLRKFPIEEDRICPNELYTMINMFACLLDGYGNFDEEYELNARVLISYEQNVAELLSENINFIVSEIMNTLDNDAARRNIDLFSVIRSINLFPKNELIKKLKDTENKEIQMADNSNPIAFDSKNDKLTTNYGGRAPKDMVKIQDTQMKHTDPIESPESAKIGKVHYRTVVSKTDENGFSVVPYIEVNNGKIVSDKPIYLTADETRYEYIAEWDEKFEGDEITVFYNGTVIKVPKEKVRLLSYSPFDEMALARSGIPFQNHSNPKRLLMGSNYERQADFIVAPERAMISTGNEVFLENRVFTARDILSDYWDNGSIADSIKISREEFINSPIVLIRTTLLQDYRQLDFDVKLKGSGRLINYSFPFLQKTSKDSTFTYYINPKRDNTYQGDDIVVYHASMDINEYDKALFTDYGHMKVDTEKSLKYGLAIGRNLRVGFTTYSSSNIDDAIVIRQGLVYENKLTSVEQYTITDTCSCNDDHFEQFGFPDPAHRIESYIEQNGLPKIGTYLKPGSLVICKYRTVQDKNIEGGIAELPLIKNKFLPNNISGEVVYAKIEDNEAVVRIASISPVEVGDKLAGRYGNKGVIGRIVPDQDMPYDAKTGEILDVCLNPNGVPSRMNISQILEICLGEAMHKQGKIAIVTPFYPNSIELVKKEMNKSGVKPSILIDGRTGLPLDRPVNVGYMYMLKLEHRVNKKMHAINTTTAINQITNQPLQGAKKDGGQALGEMESWCLISADAKQVLQELVSVQSDDIQAQRRLEQVISSNPWDISISCTNNNDKMMQLMCRVLGTDIGSTETDYTFRPLTDSAIRSFAPRGLDPSNNLSLHDENLFGSTGGHGRREDIKDRWGWVDLGCEIINPNWVIKSKINRLLIVKQEKGVTSKGIEDWNPEPINQQSLTGIIYGTKKVILEGYDYPVVINGKKRKTSKSVSDDYELDFESDYDCAEAISGIDALVGLFKKCRIEDTIEYYEKSIEAIKLREEEKNIKKDYTEEAKYLKTAHEWLTAGIRFTDFINKLLPIMPIVYRPKVQIEKREDFANQYYKKIFTCIKEIKQTGTADSKLRLYETIGQFLGLIKNDTVDIQNFEEVYFGKGRDKKGRFREAVLSKRLHRSGRTVIIPSQDPKMTVNEVGVPILMAVEMWNDFLVSVLQKSEPITSRVEKISAEKIKKIIECISTENFLKFCKILGTDTRDKAAKDLFFKLKKIIVEFLEEQVLIFGRQPSLHKFNMRAYYVKVTYNKTLELNPMVCKGYNADFDGDQMYAIAVISNSAKKEAMEKMAAKNWVINPKDSSNIMDLGQDILLGIYYSTMLHDNVTNISEHEKYNNIFNVESVSELENLVETGHINIHDLVCVTVEGRNYLSTAGRIMLNSLLPNGFTDKPFENTLKIPAYENGIANFDTSDSNLRLPVIQPSHYCELLMDGLISGKGEAKDGMRYYSLSKYTRNLYYEADIDTCMSTYQKLMEFGFHYCDLSGITVALSDITVDVDIQQYINKANKFAEKINKAYFEGLVSGTGRKSMLIDLYNSLTKYLKDKVIFDALPRNNNLAIMLDSNARGNKGQMMQTLGIVGISMKTGSESLETPILSSYGTGLSCFELFLASYGARMGVNSTQNETADAGYATRQTVFMCGGLRIVEDDCHTTETKFPLEYTEPVSISDGVNIWTKNNLDMHKNIDSPGSLKEVLQGKTLADNDEEVEKILRYFISETRSLDHVCVEQLFKHNIKHVKCTDGEYEIKYSLDVTQKDMLMHRYLVEDVGPIKAGTYLTEKDINVIENIAPDYIKVRLITTCRSENGVCAKCYGLKFDTLKPPHIGEYVGMESAQAIGEPAAQLSMSLFHTGGIIGGASAGVAYFKSCLKGSIPKKSVKALTAEKEGYIEFKTLGDTAYLDLSDRKYAVPVSRVLVENGEYVNLGDQLTMGTINIDDIGDARNNMAILRKRQLMLIRAYYMNFKNSDLGVHARHFEILARMQTTLVTVISSDDPDIPVGSRIEVAKLLKSIDNGHNLEFDFEITKQSEVISHFSGPLAGLAFERFDEGISHFVVSQDKFDNYATISALAIGEDVRDHYDSAGNLMRGKRKVLSRGKFETSEYEAPDGTLERLDMNFSPSGGIEAFTNNDFTFEPTFNLDDDTILEFAEPMFNIDETDIKVVEEKNDRKEEPTDKKPSVNIDTMDVF